MIPIGTLVGAGIASAGLWAGIGYGLYRLYEIPVVRAGAKIAFGALIPG